MGPVKEISDWLSSNSWYLYHQEMTERRTENTGGWFLQSDEFGRWKNEGRARLWVTGMREWVSLTSSFATDLSSSAGAGKTILACVPYRFYCPKADLTALQIALHQSPAGERDCYIWSLRPGHCHCLCLLPIQRPPHCRRHYTWSHCPSAPPGSSDSDAHQGILRHPPKAKDQADIV